MVETDFLTTFFDSKFDNFLIFYIMSKEKKFLIMVTANEIAGFSKKSVTSAKRFIRNHEFEVTGVTFGQKTKKSDE